MRHASVIASLALGLLFPGAFEADCSESAADHADAGKLLAEADAHIERGTAAEVRQALGQYRAAAEIFGRRDDQGALARALNGEGQCHLHLGQAPEARAALECARVLAHAFGDRPLEGEALDGLGEAFFILGERRRALDFLARAEALWSGLGDRERLALNWNAAAQAYDELGDEKVALDYLAEALVLAREVGNRLSEGVIVASMAKIADEMGEWQPALDFEQQALAAARAGGDARGEAAMLNNIGLTHYNLGDLDESARDLEDALALRRKAGDKRGEARTLTALGRISFDRGDLDGAAQRYEDALGLSRAAGDRTGEATAHSRRSDLFASQGQKVDARAEQAEARRIRHELGDTRGEIWSLTRLGTLDAALGDTDRAFASFGTALDLSRSLGDVMGEAGVLLGRAALERDLGRLTDASDDVSHVISDVEVLRTNVASPALRATYLAKVQTAYVLDIDVKMRRHLAEPGRGFDAQALEAAERMRARSLLDLLSEAGTRIREGVDAALLSRSKELQVLVNAKLERQIRLSGARAGQERVALEREIRSLMAELEDVEAKIRTSSPRYAALTHPRLLRVDEIRRLLDDETLLLEFALGDVRSYLFVVGTSSLVSRELPPRAAIEAPARRLLGAVKARSDAPPGETPAARRARRARAEADFSAASAELSHLLFGTSMNELGSRRLAIVPDGVVQYVPFAALPARLSPSGPVQPLARNHEVVTLPSASALALIRREGDERPRPPKTLAVLADPVFDGDDERVTAPRAVRPREARRAPDDLPDLPAEAGISTRLPRLPFTRREAAAILRLVPPGDRKEALDFDASRETAAGSDLANFRFVHFATHGFLDAAHPELSGIVLSLVDRAGRERPGFLSSVDVYNLKLRADLVVLSGCQTALGREVAGEGLLGMTRGFMYAGVPRILASLWKVDDVATAELMREVYAGMLGPARLSPAAALRAAELSLLEETRWRSPIDWAAFVLTGEWR